jgi:hypothetical protein
MAHRNPFFIEKFRLLFVCFVAFPSFFRQEKTARKVCIGQKPTPVDDY